MGGRRACLGRNGKYSVENCNGSLWAQGIGNITGINIIVGEWILLLGTWNDEGVWKDDSTWIDSI